jgi:hypothetical protein
MGYTVVDWFWTGLGYGELAAFCEQGYRPLGSLQAGNLLTRWVNEFFKALHLWFSNSSVIAAV